ncbi:Squalene--hopene cyclase [Fusarium oxysporum f. sp. cepae]|uniref:Terpene cyclase/mutase family member n=1 Tax=Fusarium oxysporum f. sp. cepae TaxID=396571 RepID=A0A3L6MQU3_FUSOX|nr:Squalene--hopene cyclase [Fusarium oxysporum f. sp. cepae]RKK06727.1 Squalene--hopene cyclase [Fusarium oxysporum f. sp. cepae]RKK07639.1 Squalene--hopene cyclase [Fusarium oxysporum f. sp. cepae]RKK26730.1 Squalene--hopene cyclase [Fusarium oxysporum f. sp. cepae]RKK27612.1 Squalene--hopene cyclase [Fusarium oxysporum f. sp. cepae]
MDLSLPQLAEECLKPAADYAYSLQKPDGHWLTELRSNISFTAQYVCLREIAGISLRQSEDRNHFRKWLLAQQNPDGSWSLAPGESGDLSISVEGYFALKLLGASSDDKAMRLAKEFILSRGGLPLVGIITQFLLAVFGLVKWDEIAQVPAELMLMPTWSPVNIYAFAHWSRVTAVAMMVLRHHQPTFPLPAELMMPGESFLQELYPDVTDQCLRFYPSVSRLWQAGEYGRCIAALADKAVALMDPIVKKTSLRAYSLSQCVQFMIKRQTESGYASFWPANFNCILALYCQGYEFKDPAIKRLLHAIDTFYIWKDEAGMRNQVTCGPSWDTALLLLGLSDSGFGDERLDKTVKWFKSSQILQIRGDYEVQAPGLLPGGWAFQYNNDWYPDTDDTVTILLAILSWKPTELTSDCSIRTIQWLLGMQCTNGGWGCYDVNNENYFLNLFPFGQGNEFYDAPVPDVTARILEGFGYVLDLDNKAIESNKLPSALIFKIRESCANAISYLYSTQDKATGAWKSRWHVNYINGTGSALQALALFHDTFDSNISRMIQCGLVWMKSMQNADGGWGETLRTYRDSSLAGLGDSTPSQTSWALLGLLSHLDSEDESIRRGIEYLVRTQVPSNRPEIPGRTWEQEGYVSVAFPNITWLDYTSTRHAYPMMALGRYVHKFQERSKCT